MQADYPTQLVTDFFKARTAAYVSPMGVKAMLDHGFRDTILVDVRLPGPRLTWRIPGSVAIPTSAIADRLHELPKDKLIVLYCWDTWCSLATTAALVLLGHGYRVKELYGGVAAWQALDLPVEPVTAVAPAVAAPTCSC
jgi:rhodanese-related sulfurtransferase